MFSRFWRGWIWDKSTTSQYCGRPKGQFMTSWQLHARNAFKGRTPIFRFPWDSRGHERLATTSPLRNGKAVKFWAHCFFGVFPVVSHFCWSLPNCSCLLFDFCGCLAQNRLCINTNHNVNPTKYASRHEDLETIRHCSFELPMFQHYRLKILNWVSSFQVRKFFSNCLSLKIETSHQWVFCTAT